VGAVLLALHVAAAWYMRAPSITTGNDDAVYVQLGRSVQDLRYVETYYVGEPGHVKYPPGYPVLLAALSTVFGEHLDVFLGAGILLSALALLLTADLARRVFSLELGVLLLVAAVFNPRLLAYPGMVMSESLFLFLVSLSLWAQVRAWQKAKAKEDGAGIWLAVAGAAAIASAMTRSVGVTVVAAFCLTCLMQRRWRAMLVTGVAAAVTVGSWFLWTKLAPAPAAGGEEYVTDVFLRLNNGRDSFVSMLFARASGNAIEYISKLLPAQLPLPYTSRTILDNLANVTLIVTLTAIGVLALFRKMIYAVAILAGYLALIFVWPWPVSRFISVLLPLVMLTLLVGAYQIGERLTPRWKFAWPTLVALLICATSLFALPKDLESAGSCDRESPHTSPGCFHTHEREYLAMTRWVRDSTPGDAVFVVVKEGTFGYYAQRKTVPWIRVVTADSTAVLDFVRRLGATHLALTEVTGRDARLAQLFTIHCDELSLERTLAPTTMVLRIHRPGEQGTQDGCQGLASYLDAVRTQSVRQQDF
jgi:4-amino-4-deoxy-L-arabinose transferase-like glycosyltransferase